MSPENPNFEIISPEERKRREQEKLFCQELERNLQTLQLIKERIRSGEHAEIGVYYEWAAGIESSLRAETLYHHPAHEMLIRIPDGVVAHTSINMQPDSERPTEFKATAMRKFNLEVVEFTETQDVDDNIRGKWLIVNDGFDKLDIRPYLPPRNQDAAHE